MTTSTIKNFNLSPDTFLQDIKVYNSFRKQIFHPKSDMPIEYSKLVEVKNTYNNLSNDTIVAIAKETLDIVPQSIELIQVKSTYHVLYKISDKKKSYVLKINALSEFYKDFSFLLDIVMQKKMHDLNLPALTIYMADISRKKQSFDYMIMDFVKGENLETYNNDINVYSTLGKIFRTIHELPVTHVGAIDLATLFEKKEFLGSMLNWEDFFVMNLESHIHTVHAIGVVTKEHVWEINNVFSDGVSLLNNDALSVLHNDPGTRNIITSKRNISAIIDWEDMVIGDRLWEIAFIESFLFRDDDNKKFEQFCIGYGINIQDVHKSFVYWMYYLRIALIKTISRSASYYNKEGMKIDKMRIGKALSKLRNLQ